MRPALKYYSLLKFTGSNSRRKILTVYLWLLERLVWLLLLRQMEALFWGTSEVEDVG